MKSANITHFTLKCSVKFQTENEILDTIPGKILPNTSSSSDRQLENGALAGLDDDVIEHVLNKHVRGIKPSRWRYFLFSCFVIENIPYGVTLK